ncbi:protein kinase C beta type-like [Arapaima gigas]
MSFFCLLPLFLTDQKSKKDTCNFDKEFTKMPVELTPTDKLFIMNLDQNEFQGFSYTNPEFVIQVLAFRHICLGKKKNDLAPE